MTRLRKGIFTSVMAGALLTLAYAPAVAGPGKLGDKNPDVRAEGVQEAARANNRAAATAILAALAAENDGPAGYRMAEAVGWLNSEEALDEIDKTVLKWQQPKSLFGAYWTYMGLLSQKQAKADAIVLKAFTETKDKDVFIRAAALEALAEAERGDIGVDPLLTVLNSYDPKWDTATPIIVLTAVTAAHKLAKGVSQEQVFKVVLALAEVLAKTKDDQVQWFTAKSLSNITGEDLYTDPEFWKWWVQMGGKKVEKREEGATVAGRDVPKFFKAAAVGKRVMFVIDISGSMQHPVELPKDMKNPPPPPKEEKGPTTGGGKVGKGKEAEEEEKKPEIPPPDYSKVKSKLDLAKVELIHTLKYLPEDYFFNIVIYHTPHDWIDNGTKAFVKATKANKDKFIKKVEALNWAALTNIHGALTRGFCGHMKGALDPMKLTDAANPAWDPECLKSGATTIFFLTDGFPTISDDTTNNGEVGRTTPTGNGRYVDMNNIILDVKRMNVFRKVVINTIGIGPHPQQLLQALAEMSGGEYVDRSGAATDRD